MTFPSKGESGKRDVRDVRVDTRVYAEIAGEARSPREGRALVDGVEEWWDGVEKALLTAEGEWLLAAARGLGRLTDSGGRCR